MAKLEELRQRKEDLNREEDHWQAACVHLLLCNKLVVDCATCRRIAAEVGVEEESKP